MTPNFSFKESCCRYMGVFNIPKKIYSSCSLFGLEIIIFRFPVIDSSPVFRINSVLPMKATSPKDPQSLASRRLNSGRFFSFMEISTKKRIFGIDVYTVKLSSPWFCAQIPDHFVVPIYTTTFRTQQRCKCKRHVYTSGVPRNRPSIEIAKSLPY